MSDSLTNPGTMSDHVHSIFGGSNFNLAMDFDDARAGKCASCLVKQDMSNYWVPSLYFAFKNGSFKAVNQEVGATIYYLLRFHPDDETPITAFPDGYRMLAGDPYVRSYDETSLMAKAIGWNCLEGKTKPTRNPTFPSENCPLALRAEIMFPSCWNGKDVDSANHQSHTAYPEGGESGPCPEGFKTRTPTLFYEVWWSVDPFKDLWSEALNPQQPFVSSQGDATGYGLHADFLNGWDRPVLQKAIETCTADSGVIEECPIFDLYSPDAGKCRASSFIDEQTDGIVGALPGNNPITSGPDSVTMLEEESPPKILDEVEVTGGRTADHKVKVNRDGSTKTPPIVEEESTDESNSTSTTGKKTKTDTSSSESHAEATSSPKPTAQDGSTASLASPKTAPSSSPSLSGSGSGGGSSTAQNTESTSAELPLGLSGTQWAMAGAAMLVAAVVMVVACSMAQRPKPVQVAPDAESQRLHQHRYSSAESGSDSEEERRR